MFQVTEYFFRKEYWFKTYLIKDDEPSTDYYVMLSARTKEHIKLLNSYGLK
jgi:hypothetical protein